MNVPLVGSLGSIVVAGIVAGPVGIVAVVGFEIGVVTGVIGVCAWQMGQAYNNE